MRKVLLIASILAVAAAPVWASTNSATMRDYAGMKVAEISVPSQAQNAIDTTVVALVGAQWASLPNATVANSQIVLEASIGFLGASGVDSTNLGIDYSLDGATWTTVYSVANTASNLTTSAPNLGVQFEVPAPFVRIRAKNVDATTGTASVFLAFPTQ